MNNKNGNLFVFDHGNRLRTAQGTDTYRYDAQGRRVRTAGSDGLLYEMYSLDGKLLWQRDEQLGLRFQHIYLGGSLVASRRMPIGETVYGTIYRHTDALGSPIAATDELGNTLQTTEHEPYGKMLNRTNDNRPGYTGHMMDKATGLVYMQQRYYDPLIPRFLSVDPITAYSNPVGAFNRYWYANNNPYRFTDPDGRHVCTRDEGTCSIEDAALANSFVRAAEAAHGKMRDGAAKAQLGDILGMIGTPNDGNGFKINFTSLDKGVLGQMSRDGMDLDSEQIGRYASGIRLNKNTAGGFVVAHEGVHKWDSMQPGARRSYFPASGLERMVTEINAYGMVSAMSNALGIRNAYNYPGMSWADRRRAIWDGAKRSWEAACGWGGGGCSGYKP